MALVNSVPPLVTLACELYLPILWSVRETPLNHDIQLRHLPAFREKQSTASWTLLPAS